MELIIVLLIYFMACFLLMKFEWKQVYQSKHKLRRKNRYKDVEEKE